MADRHKVPSWLQRAQTAIADRGAVQTHDDWPALAQAGDLRLAEPVGRREADTRVVLVFSVDERQGVASVALASNETDLASDHDLVISGEITGTSFDLMIETDAVARVWLIQLGRQVARVEPEVLDTARRAVTDGPEAIPEELRGLPLLGPGDDRARFKAEEQAALDALATDCADQWSDLEPAVVFDPALFMTRQGETERQRLDLLLGIAEALAETPGAEVPVAALQAQLEAWSVGDPEWLECHGHDTFQALSRLFERGLVGSTTGTVAELDWRPERRPGRGGIDQELASLIAPLLQAETRSARLLTLPDAWAEGLAGRAALASVQRINAGGPLQIIRYNLEANP